MATYLDGPLHQQNNTAIFGTFRHYRGSYGTYADETAVKRILTFSRWFWSSYQPIIIETYYEAYSGTGYSKHLLTGNTRDGGTVSIVAIVDGYDADTVTVSSTQNLGSGDYPHWVYVQISSGPYRRGTYKIFYNPGNEVSSESAAQSAGNGFYIHA